MKTISEVCGKDKECFGRYIEAKQTAINISNLKDDETIILSKHQIDCLSEFVPDLSTFIQTCLT